MDKIQKAQLLLLRGLEQKQDVESRSRVLGTFPAFSTIKGWADHLSHSSSLTPGCSPTLTPSKEPTCSPQGFLFLFPTQVNRVRSGKHPGPRQRLQLALFCFEIA